MTGQTQDQMYPWLKHLQGIADKIVNTLHVKELSYGGSWQKRGGQGAFMMLARKWDRIENMATENHYDLFGVVNRNQGDIIDDIDDLIGYLLLVRAKVHSDENRKILENNPLLGSKIDVTSLSEEPGSHYVNQDPDLQPPPAPSKHRPLSGGGRVWSNGPDHISAEGINVTTSVVETGGGITFTGLDDV